MLKPEYLRNELPKRICEVYSQIEDDMLRDIARRIRDARYVTPTAEWQLQKAQDMNILYSDLQKTLARYSGMSEEAIAKTLREAGIKSVEYDSKIYERAYEKSFITDLPPKFRVSSILEEQLQAANKNAHDVFNMTNTKAIQGAANTFSEVVDKAYLEMNTGVKDYTQAMRGAINNLAKQGVQVIGYASGRKISMEAVVRSNMITSANRMVAKMAEKHMDIIGASLVETTSHMGARPSHAEWQGKVFWWKQPHPKYPEFESSTGYGRADGLCGVNCRHSFYPYFEGLSGRTFSEDPAQERGIDNDELYEQQQTQRGLERDVRAAKKKQVIAEEIGDAEAIKQAKSEVRQAQAKVKQYVDSHKYLNRDYAREAIGKK